MTTNHIEPEYNDGTLSEAKGCRPLSTVRQFSAKNPAFPEGGLRHLIFHAEKNGFDKCIRRIGRKVLIDEMEFFRWVDQQNQLGRL